MVDEREDVKKSKRNEREIVMNTEQRETPNK